MGWAGFLVDVGVGAAVSRVVPGKWGALAGGAVGGVAGQAFEENTGVMDLVTGGVLGLAGGAAGGLANRGIRKAVSEGAESAAKRAAKAGTASKEAEAAKSALSTARTEAANARLAYKQLGKFARGRQAVMPGASDLDNWRKAAKSLLSARAADADKAAKAAEALPAFRKAQRVESLLKHLDNQFGKGTKLFHNLGRAGLIGLGSGLFNFLDDPFSGDEGGGGDPGGGAQPAKQQTPLVWDGLKPATTAGVMWEEPFVMNAELQAQTQAKESGFLLRPEKLNPTLIEWYGGETGSLAFSMVDNYLLYGDPKLKTPLELTPVPQMPETTAVQASTGGSSYGTLVKNLNAKAVKMTEAQEKVPKAKEAVEITQERGLKNIAALINGVNRLMVGIPDNSEKNFVDVLTKAFSELIQSVEDDAMANKLEADKLGAEDAADQKAARENLADSVNRFAGQQQDPGYNPNSSQIGANNPYNPGNIPGYNNPPTSQDLTDSADRFKQQAEDLQKQADKALGTGSNPSLTTPASYNPGSSQLGSPGSLGGMSGMGGMGAMGGMGEMFNMLMQQRMMRDMQDTDMSRRSPDLDPSRYDRAGAPTMAPQAQPAATTPWSNQAAAATNTAAAAAQPAVHQTGAPNGATSTQPGAAVPKRVPGEDGLVPYAFPDGRTQRVPVAVAQALDKAFADKKGTDAQAAYQGTPGAWTDSRDIGPGVDPFQLATGDVGTWIIRQPKSESQKPALVPASASDQPAAIVTVGGDTGDKEQPPKDTPDTGSGDEPQYRTALLVAFGNGESGTLEVLVAGELRQYAPEMSDTEGDFGEFAGFKHPRGVEAVDKNQDNDTTQTSGDQSAVDMPALTAPV